MKIITDAQIKERDSWESKLKRGQCTLDEALSGAMRSGAPMSAYLIECYERAVWKYTRGAVGDLAEPFGIAATKSEKNVIPKRVRDSHALFLVDSFTEPGWKGIVSQGGREIESTVGQKHPKTDPSIFEDTAFHAAAKRLRLAATTVYGIYRDRPDKKPAE